MPSPAASQSVIPPRLSPRERTRIIAEAYRRGWAFKALPDGGIEVTPPATPPDDPFELVDMSR